jgi:hypothetical protein
MSSATGIDIAALERAYAESKKGVWYIRPLPAKEFAILAHNAMPQLIAAAKERDRLREALESIVASIRDGGYRGSRLVDIATNALEPRP